MKSNLVERVELALRNPNHSPWLPELTTELVEAGWQDLYNKVGLSIEAYGTARVIARDAEAPCRIIAWLPVFSGAGSPERMLQVETLDAEFIHSYREVGVRFYSAEEINATNVLARLREAITSLKMIPTLLTTVAALIRSVHVLDPGDDNYDVSFSDPQIPFSIFVSIPQKYSLVNSLRIAEAIVHEAMHLQLTLIEKIVPLVENSSSKYFSPWKREHRTPQGILHSLYVFRVIDKFLELLLLLSGSDREEARYLHERRADIAEEIRQIQMFIDCPDLTPSGYIFVRHLIFN